MTERTTAGGEALLVLNPVQRAQQKSKEPEHEKENVTLNGLQTACQKQYLWLEIVSPFVGFFSLDGRRFYSAFGGGEPAINVILDDYVRQVGRDFK